MAKKKHAHIENNKMNIVTSCISTTLMLILLGVIMFFVCFANNFSNSLRENFTITLTLDDSTSNSQAYQLQKELRALPCTRGLNYISKEKALKEQSEALGTDPTEFLGYNPMPATFEISLKAEYANSDSLKKIVPKLAENPIVVEASVPQDLMDSLNENIRQISTVLFIIAALLMIVSFVLINNTIRLSIHSRSSLIKTMRLVGASPGFIRKPFLLKSLLMGFVAAVIAIALLAAGLFYMIQFEPAVEGLVTWQSIAWTVGLILICGLLLTWISAYFAVNRYLRNHNSSTSYHN